MTNKKARRMKLTFSVIYYTLLVCCAHAHLFAQTNSAQNIINTSATTAHSTKSNVADGLAAQSILDHNNAVELYLAKAQQAYQEKKYTKAIIGFQQALEIEPNNIDALWSLARSYQATHNNRAAIKCYLQIAEYDTNYHEIDLNIGINYYFEKEYDHAQQYLQKAIERNPNQVEAYTYLGRLYAKKADYQNALNFLGTALTIAPHNFEVHHYLGRTFQKMNNMERALEQFQNASTINPTDITNLLKIGNLYNILNKTDDALNTYMQVLEINPTFYAAMYNIGYTLKRQGHLRQAINIYKKILEQKPDYALVHFSLATAYLTLGDFANGLPEYEWRWKISCEKPKPFTQPVWNGSDPTNKSILVYGEQGLGDTLQFIRYAQLIKQRGGTVIVEAQKPLVPILKLCPYIDQVITQDEILPHFDFHIPLMSLPLMFNTTVDTIPNTIPFLYADKALVTSWRKRIPQNKFKIGICWHGNDRHLNQPLQLITEAKSIELKQFAPIGNIEGVSLYSLQKIDALDEISLIKNSFILNTFDDTFDNDNTHGRFMDTAAVIANLDLIIGVDAAVALLAGGLGAPTWILLSQPADWRWFENHTTTPWYPNVRLFRQKNSGNWEAVIQEVVTEIKKLISK